MNVQRIVKLTTLDGEVYCFSAQPLQSGLPEKFATLTTAEVFIERFYFSALEEIREIASWSGAGVSFAHEYRELSEEELYHGIAKSLFEQSLYVFQTPKQAPTTFYAPTSVPEQIVAKRAKTSDGGKEASTSRGKGQHCNEPLPESSKKHDKVGDPVSMVTGEENLTLTDIQLPFGLTWQRTYRSSLSDKNTILGFGWRHNFQYELAEVLDEKAQVVGWLFMDEMGDTILFPSVPKGEFSYQIYAGATCQHHDNGFLLITLSGEVQIKFHQKEDCWLASEIRLGHMKIVNLEYSRNRRITHIKVNLQPKLELQYNKQGLLVEVRHPKTQSVLAEYQYDSDLCLSNARNEFGLAECYQYNDSNLLTRRVRPTGFSHYFEWVGEGAEAQCVRNWADENIYHYVFEFKSNNSKVVDSLGSEWKYKHNEQGKLLTKESPEARLWEYEYDSAGNLVNEIAPDGSFVRYVQNQFGHVASKIHSSGATEQFEYNEFGQCIKHQFPDGEVETRHFNTLGQLVSLQRKDGQQARYLFDKYGRQVEEKRETGSRTQWWWNDSHQLLAKKINQSLVRYSYDESDRVNGIAYPEGLICGLECNKSNLLTRLYFQNDQDETIREHRYEYDDFGRVKYIHTPRGSTQIAWSRLAQPTDIIKQDNSSFSFSYDAERNLKTIERSDGCKYEFEYTSDGQISRTINFDQLQTNYTYDKAGRVCKIANLTRNIHLQYNELDYIAKIQAIGNGSSVESHYQHSLGGKLIRAHNRFSNVSYTYLGTKLVSEEQGRFSFVNQYQDNGLLRSQRYDDGTEVLYEYDQFGTVCGLTIHSNGSEREDSITFEYDELQRLSRITYGAVQERKEFDGIGRLKRQIWNGFERKYHYNAQHFLSLIVDSEKGALHYHYDELGQLKRVKTQTSEESYVFDSFGNVNDESAQREQDRLIEYHGIRYDYDELGNRTSSQGNGVEQHCSYDAKGQLICVESEGHLCQFEYDALGRRTKKISENGATEFIWQGSHLVGEYSRSGYRWYLYQPNCFVPLALIEDGECYFFQCNQIGAPERLVDSNGQVVWQAEYDTFGFAHVGIETVKNNLRLQGQYFDIETGLHYNLARYYDPQIGRFIQPDPLGLLGGTNHYQFAPNPVSWVDPLGLCAKEDTPTVLAGHNDNSPEKSVYYAMGSGNYQATITQASTSYKLHAYSSPHYSALGINDVHMALDAAGMLPGVGIVPDAINTALYGLTGDFVNAGISFSAMVPIVGQGAMATKYAQRLDQVVDHGNNVSKIRRWKAKIVSGRKVYQRDDLFDPNLIDEFGKTNIERMKKGRAPIGHDGLEINLHHLTQDEPGAMAEISSMYHSQHDRILHIYTNQYDKSYKSSDGVRHLYSSSPPSMDRRPFNKWKKSYWIERAIDYEGLK
ncbi:RHS repeat-associated core domain-containing protein [Vibrio alfacsensis]|uniref:RHS repeat-associated core domain-containing protein n=1 Tax=Vibrio alfacsensis TaxID=1074311 RepID=UPI004069333E